MQRIAFHGANEPMPGPVLPKAGVSTVSLDLSLQMQVSIKSLLQFKDTNPCSPAPTALGLPASIDVGDLPRVQS
jgi:hypothetical protein